MKDITVKDCISKYIKDFSESRELTAKEFKVLNEFYEFMKKAVSGSPPVSFTFQYGSLALIFQNNEMYKFLDIDENVENKVHNTMKYGDDFAPPVNDIDQLAITGFRPNSHLIGK